MDHYTVVISDVRDHDAGFRGTRPYWWLARHFGAYAELGLYWFLQEYYGDAAVTLTRPSELLRMKSRHKTDWLFVGLPTSLNDEHLRHVDFRQMVMYDSSDLHGVNFEDSDQAFLSNHTDICLKNWRDDRLDYPCQIGLLPIKRPPLNNKMRAAIRLAAAKQRLGLMTEKSFDVGFVAQPTGDLTKNQRIRWLIDLKRERPDLKLWGGLVGGKSWEKVAIESGELAFLKSCWLSKRKIGYLQYFAGLCQSKLALAPAGYAPWSYRHLEAIYARSIVVSNDLSHYEFLIPFPRAGMAEVADDESIVTGIESGLRLYRDNPAVTETNIEHLGRYLKDGRYSRECPAALERFWDQMDAA